MSVLERRVVELSRSPRAFLILDHDGAFYRGAHWRERGPGDRPQEGSKLPFDQLVADGLLPEGARREQWLRDAGQNSTLAGLVLMLFDEASVADTVLFYLEAVGVE